MPTPESWYNYGEKLKKELDDSTPKDVCTCEICEIRREDATNKDKDQEV